MKAGEMGRAVSFLPIDEHARRVRAALVTCVIICELRKQKMWDLLNFLHSYSPIWEKDSLAIRTLNS